MKIIVRHATSWKEKALGLIGKKVIEPLYFETRWGIHTFGLTEPIDVLILDEKNTVITLKENLKPNRIFLWNPKYKKVVEVPKRTIIKEKLKKGKRLLFEQSGS